MKILLDECVPQGLCKSFPEHECHGARRAGFGGKTNGELLELAEQAGFDVLVTVDQSIPHQQKLGGRKLALLIVHAKSNKLAALLLYPGMPRGTSFYQGWTGASSRSRLKSVGPLADEREQLIACFVIIAESAQHGAGDGAGVLLFHSTHHHAEVVRFANHCDTARLYQ